MPRPSQLSKHLLVAFALALVFYVLSFAFIEHRRTRQGPWQVSFQSDAAGEPFVMIQQGTLGLSNVRVRFLEEKIATVKLEQAVAFTRPRTNVPFGQVIFIDTTYLPGTVAFDFFGHEVQVMPRVLTLNRKEIPWRSDAVLELRPQEKLTPTARKSQWKR